MSLLSSLVISTYLGVIPLILVAGMVLAVRRRHQIGARASKQLVAGAGLLLLAHLFTALRPLLGNVIGPQGSGFGSVADLINAVSLMQFAAYAGGFGLLIAAALSRRPHTDHTADHEDPDNADQATQAHAATS